MTTNRNLDPAKLAKFNQMAREVLDSYYKTHSADDFFRIDAMLKVCYSYELTTEDVPCLIEMKNVIVMG